MLLLAPTFGCGLHYAAKTGNIERATKLLDEGADVSEHRSTADPKSAFLDSSYWEASPLCQAVVHRKADMVAFLLTRGADPNDICDGRVTVLICSLTDCFYHPRKPDANIADMLLRAGADPRGETEKTLELVQPIFRAEEPTTLKLMLDNGADPNAMSEDGRTPIMVQATLASYDGITFLLQHGADVSVVHNVKKREYGVSVLVPGKVDYDNENHLDLLDMAAGSHTTRSNTMFGPGPVTIARPTEVIDPDRLRAIELLIANGADPNRYLALNYNVEIEGGHITRLTYHGHGDIVDSWNSFASAVNLTQMIVDGLNSAQSTANTIDE
jgi:ankyrin repeat protein